MYVRRQATRPYGGNRPKIRLSREVIMKPINPDQLRRRRLSAGFTQYELAALCKCSQAAISGLETGNLRQCSEDLARVLCKWLGRDMDELFVVSPTSSKARVLNAKGVKHAPAMATC